MMYERYLKRMLDLIISMCALIVLMPLLAVIMIAIKLDSSGSVFFKQKRIGKNKEIFEIYKFRTMLSSTPKDMPTHLLENPDACITKTGKFLRKTSLDELPQLINIFKGEMSFIGPRPALWNQFDLIEARDQVHANDIRPGLSGWAQIHGRDELSIPKKAKLDGYYVQHLSFLLDVKCFFGTFISVFKQDGIVEGKHDTLGENI